METVTLRCSFCGSRASVQLNENTRRMLDSQNSVARVCTVCGGATNWEPVVTTERLRMQQPGIDKAASRVLLIDDDQSILQVIGKVLSSRCDVETADSARDAAMMLVRGDYDIIISDIRMPGFDGTQLFEFLEKHLPEYRKRVIFLTGDTGNPATMAFLEKTGAPYLTKPVDIPQLLSMLQTVASAQNA